MTVGLMSRKNMRPVSYLYRWKRNGRRLDILRLWRSHKNIYYFHRNLSHIQLEL